MADDPLLREAELLRAEVSEIAAALARTATAMDPDTAARLTDQIEQFNGIASAIAGRTTAVERINRNLTRTVWVLACTVVAIVVLASFAVINAERIGDLQQRTSSEVLCPVFQIYLDAYHPDAVPADRLAEYERAYRVMRHSYDVLGCTAPSG